MDDDVEIAGGRSIFAEHLGGIFFRTEHLGEVDDELRTHFLVDEFLALGLVLDLAHVEVKAVFLETTFYFFAIFGLANLDFDTVVFAYGLRMACVGVAGEEVVNDVANFFVGGDDMIKVDHGVGEVDIDFRTQGGFKVEIEVLGVLEVGRLLLVEVAEGISDEVELVVEDVFVEVLGNQVI